MGDYRSARRTPRSGDRQRGRTGVRSLSECMKLRYERGALADLDEIFAYIAADDRKAAGRLVTRIEDAAARCRGCGSISARTVSAPHTGHGFLTGACVVASPDCPQVRY